MTPDLDTRLRDYCDHLEDLAPAVSVDEILTKPGGPEPARTLRKREPKRRFPRWAIGLAAAAVVLLSVGVVALLVQLIGSEQPPVVTQPPPTTTPTVVEEETSFPGAVEWTRVPLDGAVFDGAQVFDLARFGSELVAVGAKDLPSRGPAVWVSLDGVSWMQVYHDTSMGFAPIFDVTLGGPGLVAVGEAASGAGVWTSSDGRDWTFLALDDGSVASVVSLGSRLVAVGGCGEESAGASCVGKAWVSDDGLTWNSVSVEESLGLYDVTIGGPGFVAVGDATGFSSGVWVSEEGVTWSRVEIDPSLFGETEPSILWSVTNGGPGLVAVGEYEGAGAVWTSPDGFSWDRVFVDAPESNLRSVVSLDGGGLLAMGRRDNGFRPGVWNSPDGLTWAFTELPGEFERVTTFDMIARQESVVAVGRVLGDGETPTRPVFWTAPISDVTLPPTTTATTNPPVTVTTPAPEPVPSPDPISGDGLGIQVAVSSSILDIRVSRDAVWVGDSENALIHRIDPATNQVAGSIELGDGVVEGVRRPRLAQWIATGEETVWVGDINFGEVAGYHISTGSLIGDWTVVGYPSQVAIGEGAAWAVDLDGLYRFDERTGDQVTVIEPGSHKSFWWLTISQGSVWVAALPDEFPWRLVKVDPVTNSINSATDLLEINLTLIAYDLLATKDDAVWVFGGNCGCPGERSEGEGRGRIIKVDPVTNQILASESGDFFPFDVAIGPNYLWVVNAIDEDTRTVIRIDPQTLRVVGGPLVFDARPTAIDIGHGSLWVSHGQDGFVTRIDLADLP